MSNDDLEDAWEAERLGDAAQATQAAAAHYREAQRLLLPVGMVWTSRESYDSRMQALERVQQKIYGAPHLTVWDFSPGLVVRVGRTFLDFDGQEIRAGAVLHFLEKSYFPYDGGHTLRFVEKTVHLAGISDEHERIIENAGNAWFQQIP